MLPQPNDILANPVDVGEFGSGEAVERPDLPERGIIRFTDKDHVYQPMSHWEQFDWKFTAKRWGHYQVRLTYKLTQATLAVQFKLGEVRLKKLLTASGKPRRTYLGEIFIAEPGEQAMALYTPSSGAGSGFTIQELALVPTNEGDVVKQEDSGIITLLAKDATTWSEMMRYEPKPEKNCLGFWTDPDDFAEWEFTVNKPGRYKVTVVQGCGTGNGGSRVAVKSGDQKLSFIVKETGGFQNWQEIEAGVIELKTPGAHRLVVDPENKAGKAVLDVQKVVLTPAS